MTFKKIPLLLAALLISIITGDALAQAPQLVYAVSRKAHGGINYDIGLPLAGASGIECRSVGAGVQLVLNFDKDIQSGNAAVTAGAAALNGAPTASSTSLTINLANVANAQSVTVAFSNVVPAGGGTAASGSVTFRVLEGDVNASGSVTVADVNLCKYNVGRTLSGFNFRSDVNLSNSVSVADVNLVKFRVGGSVAGGAAANTAPTVSDIANATTTAGQAANVNFTINDGQTPARSLAIVAESSNQTLLPNSGIAVTGNSVNRTITLTPASGQTGSAVVSIMVSDGQTVGGKTFTLTVTQGSPGGGTGSSKLYVASLRPEGNAQSPGTGSSTLQLSADETYAIVKVQYSNLTTTKTGMHLHGPANAGESGQIIFDLDTTPPQQDGSWKWVFGQSGNVTVAEQIAAIKTGRIYVNVHSSRYPGGELRGHYLATTGSETFTPPPPPPALPGGTPTKEQAVRFLQQATFGANDESIARVQQLGYEGWINEQLSLPQTTQNQFLQERKAVEGNLNFNHYQDAWWKLVNTAPDQLRQRVAFALSEIHVVSESFSIIGQFPEGMGRYYDMLGRNATGNFRSLIEEVTLSPVMGEFLNMRGSHKADPTRGTIPNENYPRELLQLFTIGLQQLHPDGTLKLNSQGQPIDTYHQDIVIGFARALTGWDYGQDGTYGAPQPNYSRDMTPLEQYHETGSKLLLNGVTVPAGGNCRSDLKAALDNAFNHSNVGPFICKQLIQRMVTSNPSPGYVYRVAQKFENNGSGVRGDMKAVIKAILLDYEARSDTMISQQGYGKLKEPLLRTTQVMRALHGYSSSGWWAINNVDEELKQTAMRAPTVFNFFEPAYVHPGLLAENGLLAPEFQITNETTTITVSNWLYWGIFYGFKYGDIKINHSTEVGLAGNPTAHVERLNLLLCAGQMSPESKAAVINHLNTIPAGDPLTRAKTAAYLVAISAQCAAQK